MNRPITTDFCFLLEHARPAVLPYRYSIVDAVDSNVGAAGVSLFYVLRLVGWSVEQIDKTYGHLLPESEEYLRRLLDAFDGATHLPELGTSRSM